jgi:hypothetical protein
VTRIGPAVDASRSRRGVLLLAMATLLLLGMSPLFAHHLLTPAAESLFSGRDHLLALCLIALHALLEPVHGFFHLLFLAGIVYAAWDRASAAMSLRRTLYRVASTPVEAFPAVAASARAAGLALERVRIVAGLPTPALTVGWLEPVVYVAAELPDVLSADELTAVMAHERAHVDARDPLRVSVLRFMSSMLFWLPALRRLSAEIAEEAELRADDEAARRHGLVLASALVRLGSWKPASAAAAGVGVQGAPDSLEWRVLRLVGEGSRPRSKLTRRSILLAGSALLLAWTSGLAVSHPLPEGIHAHCEEHASPAVFHLFCRACVRGLLEHCPHTHSQTG